MDDPIRVLFLCVHNSARSQMAEAFLRLYGGARFRVESAGLEPGTLHPYVVKAMAEVGIDISGNRCKSAFELYRRGELFQYVITVCDAESAESCPVFPGPVQRLHWSFPDPSRFTGDEEEIMARVREVRDAVALRVWHWVGSIT